MARDKYQGLRKELDRLLPELAERFAEGDQLVSEVELFLPSGQIRGLMAEIEDGASHFGFLDAREQKAQLMIWIGKLRRLQSTNASRPQDEIQQLESIFRRLVSLSKQYMPGYIDAFQEGYTADWDLYIADAQEQFRIASEQGRRDRETRQQREEQAAREAARKKTSRESALVAIDDLRAVIATHKIPDDGLDEFNAVLARVVNLGGSSEPELLELVRPFRELITGSDFRALRKHLDRIQDEEDKLGESAAVRERYRELIALTRGRRALMIGGAVREDARKSLQQTFEFDELEWEPYEGQPPRRAQLARAAREESRRRPHPDPQELRRPLRLRAAPASLRGERHTLPDGRARLRRRAGRRDAPHRAGQVGLRMSASAPRSAAACRPPRPRIMMSPEVSHLVSRGPLPDSSADARRIEGVARRVGEDQAAPLRRGGGSPGRPLPGGR